MMDITKMSRQGVAPAARHMACVKDASQQLPVTSPHFHTSKIYIAYTETSL